MPPDISNIRAFTEQMLVNKGMLRFQARTKTFVDNLLEPDVVRQIIKDLPYMPAAAPAPPLPHVLPKQGFLGRLPKYANGNTEMDVRDRKAA